MGEALIGFGYCLVLSSVALLAFWALQIRYGETSDLGPKNLLVRLFAKKTKAPEFDPVRAEVVSASESAIFSAEAVAAGGLAVITMFGMMLDGKVCHEIRLWPGASGIASSSTISPPTILKMC